MDKLFVLYGLLIFPGLVGIIRGLLQNLYLWQVKEYRFDRFLSHFRFEKDYSHVGTLLWFMKVALLIVGILYLLFPGAGYLSFSFVIIFILYFLHLEWFLLELARKRLVRPRFRSSRNIIILTVVLIVIFLLYGRILWWLAQFDYSNIDSTSTTTRITEIFEVFNNSSSGGQAVIPLLNLVAALALLGTLVVDLLVPIWVMVLVFITSPIAKISRLRIINKARNIIAGRGDNLRIIGITGSYGKTTTKELIYEILSKKYKTEKTLENRNTAVGIAQSIISQIKPDTEIFVAEMGSYKTGEIKEATKVVPLDIALITALTQQHLSLFGSKENLFAAKYELIEGLKENGIAVFNGNDESCIKMATKTDKKKIFYYQLLSSQDAQNEPEQLSYKDTQQPTTQNSNENLYLNRVVDIGDLLEVDLTYQNIKYSFKAPLKESRFALNLMAAMAVCLQVGMNIDEVIAAVGNLETQNNYLGISKAINDSQVINDGKTSNVAGFQLALSFLNKKAQSKKWVMTQGIIELGSEKSAEYKTLAESICEKANGLITNDRDLLEVVKILKPGFQVIQVGSIHDFANAYKFNVAQGDTVLIEGVFPGNILNQIIINEK